MIEKRRSSRIPVEILLSISSIYNQESTGIDNLEAPIEVVDISTYGIGLVSECILPLNYYFNAQLVIDLDGTVLHEVVKIIRVDILEKDVYAYGCEFIDLSPEGAKAIEACNIQN